MTDIKKQFLSFDKTDLNLIVIIGFLSLLVISSLTIGLNGWLFLLILLVCIPFIWQTPQAGFLACLATTMIFGEHFSLLPFSFGENVYKIYILDFVLVLSFLSWFLTQPIKQKFKIKTHKKNIWLFVFWLIILANLTRGFLSGTADSELSVATFKNYSYLFVYFMAILMFKNKQDLLRIFKVLVLTGLPLIGFIIYGLISGHGLWSEITPGTRYLSGLHAYYLTFSIIFIFTMLANKQYLYGKFKTAFVFLIQLTGLITSMFRHLWLGIATVFLMFFSLFHFNQKQQFFRMLAIGFLILIILSSAIFWFQGTFQSKNNFFENDIFISTLSRIKTLGNTGYTAESAVAWRLETWKIALNKFSKNPIFGIGLGHKFYFQYRGSIDLVDMRNIHNDIISLLTQLGIIGFLPFVIFSFYQLKGVAFLIKKQDDFLALSLAGFWLIALFGTFFAIYLMFNGTAIFYWTIMAMISILINNQKQKI